MPRNSSVSSVSRRCAAGTSAIAIAPSIRRWRRRLLRVTETVQGPGGRRPGGDLDPLVLLGLGAAIGRRQTAGEIQPDALVAEAGAREEGRQLRPLRRVHPDLLHQLPPGTVQRRLALDVELAGRDLQRVGHPGHLARLARQPHMGGVDGEDADGAGMPDLTAGVATYRYPDGLEAGHG